LLSVVSGDGEFGELGKRAYCFADPVGNDQTVHAHVPIRDTDRTRVFAVLFVFQDIRNISVGICGVYDYWVSGVAELGLYL